MNVPLHSVSVRRLIKAHRSHVFEAFSTVESLSQWFSPSADITIELLRFEFEPQGDFLMRYTMPNGSQPLVGGKYEKISRPDEIVFTWMWKAGDPHANIPTRVSIQFNEQGMDTELVLTHEQLPKEACERHAKGWEATLGRIELGCILNCELNTGAVLHD